MERASEQRLSPRALCALLEASHAESETALVQTTAMAETHPHRRRERRLIGVAVNSVPWQLEVSSERWRHHALDDVVAGIRAHADASELDVLLLTGMSSEVTGQVTHYGDLCRKHRAAGIILVAFVPQEPELAVLAGSEFPCVSVDSRLIGPRSGFITCDNVGGAAMAVRHLAELGRKRIAYIGGWGHEPVSLERRLGYESALDELGLERREEYVRSGGWLHGRAFEQARGLLELGEPPDAIFAASDRMAVGAMLACEKAGLEIPADVAIVGFDDEDFTTLSSPSLTTIHQNRRGVGTAAVEALLRILDRPDVPPPTLTLPVELVIRESTVPASATAEQPRGGAHETVESGASPAQERLSVDEVFRQLGKEETFQRRAPGEVSDEWRESWLPENRRTIALAADTTPDQSYRHAFFDEVFYGLRASAHAHSADLLLLTRIWPGKDAFPPFLELCHRYRADGIVVASLPPSDPEMISLTRSGFPCVAFDVELLGERTAFVSFDNVEGAASVVRHLAESGRRRIAFIGGRGEERPSVDRQLGYESELARLGLPHLPEYIRSAQWLHDRAYEATKEMLALPEPPDAIFAASDIMAIGAMAAVEDAGLRIPGDVAVAGIDDLEVANMVTPSLTSVRQSQLALVTAIMDALSDLLDNPRALPKATILPVELVVRESTSAEKDS